MFASMLTTSSMLLYNSHMKAIQTEIGSMKFCELVSQVKTDTGLSYAKIAAGLNACLPDAQEHYSYEAPRQWMLGKHRPPLSVLEAIERRAPEGSWQRRFAAGGVRIVRGEPQSPPAPN